MKSIAQVMKCACAVAVLVAALAAKASAQTREAAWDRWGITQGAFDPQAEPQFATAFTQLYAGQYDSARLAYAELTRKYPNSAEAHLGLSLGCRYAGKRDSAFDEAAKALVLDSEATGVLCNYADLLQPGRGSYGSGPQSDSARYEASVAASLRASRTSHRYATYAHVALWIDYLQTGRLANARQEMHFLADKGYFPPMLLDFGRNMMSGLPPDAILFTNGDNDTEPLLCLQTAGQFRADVTIVNGTFLNLPKLMAAMRDSMRLPLTLTDQELLAKPKWDDIRDNIINNALKQNRPVYFAATFAPGNVGDWKDHLIGEGLVKRVVAAKTGESLDVARTAENVKSWRMATAGRKVDWQVCMSPMVRHVAELNINYAVVYLDLANLYKGQEDFARVDEMCRQAYNLMSGIGDNDRAEKLAALWLNLNPGSAEARKLNEK